MRLLSVRVFSGLVLALSLVVIVGYQLTRDVDRPSEPRVFVPSAGVFDRLPDSWRVTVSDVYWLYLIQYYGDHAFGDRRFDSLPDLLDLVTDLSPTWEKPYVFGAFGLLDHGRPDLGYRLLERGFESNPDSWRLPFNLGIFAYWWGAEVVPEGADKDEVAAGWLTAAAGNPGRPAYVPRLAAALVSKGNDRAKAVTMWTEVYAQGDEYSRAKAVAALKSLLPTEQERRAALQEMASMLSPERWLELSDELLEGRP